MARIEKDFHPDSRRDEPNDPTLKQKSVLQEGKSHTPPPMGRLQRELFASEHEGDDGYE